MKVLQCGYSPHFIRWPAKTASLNLMTVENKKEHQQEGKLTTIREVVSYLVKTYGIDDVIAKAKGEIFIFKQHTRMTVIRYFSVL